MSELHRVATVSRKTAETQIDVRLDLDGTGQFVTETGIGFFDHMLSHIAKHGVFDIEVRAVGDLHIDPHHTIEDTAICLGEAFAQALGDFTSLDHAGRRALHVHLPSPNNHDLAAVLDSLLERLPQRGTAHLDAGGHSS